MADSKIEWTDKTWNPVRGCLLVSPGCVNCYAQDIAHRFDYPGGTFEGLTGKTGKWNGKIELAAHKLDEPLHWKKPCLIFVNSMSDMLHKDIPDTYTRQVFDVMRKAHWHTFQILTKRPERLPIVDRLLGGQWPKNVWMGVSIESEKYLGRIDHLRACKAHTKFLSLEPLLGDLPNLDLTGIDWVIAGGESGQKARQMDISWVRKIRDKCVKASVPFHFKQWGAYGSDGVNRYKKQNGRELDGRTWDGKPGDGSQITWTKAQ